MPAPTTRSSALSRAADRALFVVARALLRLPPRVLVRGSGRPPVRMDGQRLHPEMQLLVALRATNRAPALWTLEPPAARERLAHEARTYAGPAEPVGAVRDLSVPGGDGPRPARLYSPAPDPAAPAPRPLLVFLHGGGYVLGDLDTHDAPCRLLCRHTGGHVLSVDYRLAPEDPAPAGLDDARAALTWALEHGGELGADPSRVLIGGDSAGGNLATAAAQAALRDGGRLPAGQVLIYPSVDFRGGWASLSRFAHGFFLDQEERDWFERHYLSGTLRDVADPRVSPLLGPLAGLPPALVVTAGMDPLRDEGEAYVAALREARVPVIDRRYPGMLHGFINMTGISPAARAATLELAGLVGELAEG